MRIPLIVALLTTPGLLSAQARAFSPLLGGYVLFRAASPWKAVRVISQPSAEGVLLISTAPADSSVSAMILAYSVSSQATLQGFSDSLLQTLPPSALAIRTTDTSLGSERVVVWTSTEPSPPLIVMDRFIRLDSAVLFARVVMPAIPPALPDQVANRLRSIDDLLTTVHAGGRLLFPNGAGLGLKVY